MTPEGLDGHKLRMPPGEGWQVVGTALGATPVPVPFAEVYTALQTCVIDRRDNGIPATRSVKSDGGAQSPRQGRARQDHARSGG
ncbi:hypothetical protein IQ782_05385 [Salipiger pacificus]|uniref:Uncharacterized protein n=2 Tax=Salipiger mangrovisoli TaxID=2865933 RepID=A0ABR9WYA7_9RHOB|nr:hypothetical protein [Salipiger mangrovisoli]